MHQGTKHKTPNYKTLRNIGEIFYDIGFAMVFKDMTTKAQTTKVKIGKLDHIKNMNYCIPKDTANRMKNQPMDWGEVFANHISYKGVIARLYKELQQLNNKKQPNF